LTHTKLTHLPPCRLRYPKPSSPNFLYPNA